MRKGIAMDNDLIAQAEKNVNDVAARYAYQCTDNIPDQRTQMQTFTLIKESIILGAHLMQEELLKLQDHE